MAVAVVPKHRTAVDLRDVHDAVHCALNHARSARALIPDTNTLGVARLDATIGILDELLSNLRWGGVPA